MDLKAGTLLMVSYYYPPIAAAGTHRIMNFSRELERLGWDVTVISCSDFTRNAVDPGLLTRLGDRIKIRRAPCTDVVERMAQWKGALRSRRSGAKDGGSEAGSPAPKSSGNGQAGTGFFDFLTRLLKTPDSMLSFIPGAVLQALPSMMGNRPDVIFSSAPPYSCHLAALALKSLFRVPWVADFRDPWAENPFRENNPYDSLRKLNERLEAWVVREADLVIANTSGLEAQFRRTYPHRDRVITLNNGFDPALLERFGSLGMEDRVPLAGCEKIRIVHTGNVYGLRSPRYMIDALGALQRKKAGHCRSFRVEFFGNVADQDQLEEQARSLGVEECLTYAGQVDHEQALKKASQADILLILGVMGDKPEIQVPSKIFEYLAMKKPILSFSKRGGAIHRILEDSGVPFLIADLEDRLDIQEALERTSRNDFEGGNDWQQVENFAFDRLALRLEKVLLDLKYGRSPVQGVREA